MIDALLYALGVLVLVVGLCLSIALHELGHMLWAKKFGVKVTQYFVGFGRTLWSTRRGETEYGVKLVPLGGYVKLVGMMPPGKKDDGKVRRGNTGMFTQLISEARSAEYENVQPGDEHRLFYRQPVWRKVVVMVSGVLVNLLLAYLIFGAVFMLHGVSQFTTTVEKVSDCVIPASEQGRRCTPQDPVAPAKKAGLQPGDKIVAINGSHVGSWSELVHLIRNNENDTASITYLRDGERHTTTTRTTVTTQPSLKHPQQSVQVGFLGVTSHVVLEQKGPWYTLTTMADYTWRTLKLIGTLPGKLVDVGKAALGMQPRQPDSPMSVVGASRIAGELTSTDRAPLGTRLIQVVLLLAGINLFLGMINLVPLLPLDGGHVAGAVYEGGRRRLARIRGRPDPGHFDVAKLLPVGYAMAGVIVLMSVLLIYADIVAPVQIPY